MVIESKNKSELERLARGLADKQLTVCFSFDTNHDLFECFPFFLDMTLRKVLDIDKKAGVFLQWNSQCKDTIEKENGETVHIFADAIFLTREDWEYVETRSKQPFSRNKNHRRVNRRRKTGARN